LPKLNEPKTVEQLEKDVQNLADIVQTMMVKQMKQNQQIEKVCSMFSELIDVANNKPFNPVEETK
jgi:predicted transcriptional regulator